MFRCGPMSGSCHESLPEHIWGHQHFAPLQETNSMFELGHASRNISSALRDSAHPREAPEPIKHLLASKTAASKLHEAAGCEMKLSAGFTARRW